MDISKKIQDHKLALNQNALSSGPFPDLKTERRKFPRTELSCPVEVVLGVAPQGSVPVHSRTDNISNGGCHLTLVSPPSLSPGDMVNLNLKIPRQTPNTYLLESLRKQARIVRIEPAGPETSDKTAREEGREIDLALEFCDPGELSLD